MRQQKRRLIIRWSKREKDLVVDGRAQAPDFAWLIHVIKPIREELESRGYDLTTFRVRVEHKNQAGLDAPVTRS